MIVHGNAKLGPAGRLALTQAIADGMTQKAAAAAFCVSPATAHRWWHRRLAGDARGAPIGRVVAGSLQPSARSPRLLDARAQQRICEARQRTGWGPRLVAGATGYPHSTVWKVLHRHGISRAERRPRDAARRYEWPCPGDLLHMDSARYARFERPGHRITGDRSQRSRNWMADGTRVGYDFAHAIVDDHSRLAYVELLADEKAATVTAFVTRALAWFEARGIHAKRLMTDNAWSYTHNTSLRELLLDRDIKHLRTQAYRPQTAATADDHQLMRLELFEGEIRVGIGDQWIHPLRSPARTRASSSSLANACTTARAEPVRANVSNR